MQFVYFIPTAQVTAEAIQRHGLAVVAPKPNDSHGGFGFRGVTVYRHGDGINLDPDGQPLEGKLLSMDSSMSFDPAVQTWNLVQDEGFEPHWICADPKDLPGPADLARAEMVDGHAVTLADGNDWIVPLARCFPAGSRLPSRITFGANRGVTTEIRAEYRDLFDRAWALAAEFYHMPDEGGEEADGKAEYTLTLSDEAGLALDALRLNYRLDWAEANLLGILDTPAITRVLCALIDVPGFQKLLAAEISGQKKTDGPSDTNSGNGD